MDISEWVIHDTINCCFTSILPTTFFFFIFDSADWGLRNENSKFNSNSIFLPILGFPKKSFSLTGYAESEKEAAKRRLCTEILAEMTE